jgi:hypothetical protein
MLVVRAPEPAQPELAGLPAVRGAQSVHHKGRRPAGPRYEPEQPETVLRKGARADPPAIGSLPWRVLSRDREKAPALAPDHRALVECADDLRRLRVDQARGIQALVRECLSRQLLASRWPSPALATWRRSSVLRPASRVPLATARSISRSSACMPACRERVSVAANLMRSSNPQAVATGRFPTLDLERCAPPAARRLPATAGRTPQRCTGITSQRCPTPNRT